MKQIKYCDFTEPELDVFRKLCNFTDDERTYFEMRAKDKSNVQISMAMNVSISTVANIAKRVKKKILKIIA